MFFSSVIKLYKSGSVSVCGMKGSGKDVLQGNVIARRKSKYISNVDYTNDDRFIPLDFNLLNLKNTYDNFISGNINKYIYPYPLNCDIYISDCGIIFPAQYCNELNKKYLYMATFMALSRQLGQGTEVHTNSQNLSRVYDKIREQSDIYIRTNWVFKPFLKIGLVLQSITIYDKYESAQNRVKPCRVSKPLTLNANARVTVDTYRDSFFNQHGTVKKRLLLYRNLSKHDTYLFKSLLEGKK